MPERPTADQLRERVRARAENRPGVYRMLGPSGQVLYVGKSVRVRTRLLSYFRADRGEKAAEIVAQAHGVEWDYVPSEFAALLLELELIKRYRPLYNVAHKWEGQLCFLKLTAERAPRLLVVGEVVADRGTYFGPFRGRRRLSAAARELSDLLGLRDCRATTPMPFADQLELFRHERAPLCVRPELGRCLAPCAGRCTRTQYLEHVAVVHRFLDGEDDRPTSILRERMRRAADRWQFEYAAELRDRRTELDELGRELRGLRSRIAGLTFVYAVPGHAGDDRLYVIRRGAIRAELPAPGSARAQRAVAAEIAELIAPPARRVGIGPQEADQMLLLDRWFRLRPEELARTTGPEAWLGASEVSRRRARAAAQAPRAC